MLMPKYLRPIRDVEAHKLTGLEKAVRMVIFCPFLLVFSFPRAVLLTLAPIALFIALFAPAAIDSFINEPGTYRFEIAAVLGFGTLLLFSNMLAKAIRRYFLPFG
ncbi:hypothetical protein ACFW0F_22310 [Brucella anthropi]|uniref:hypothetical protein n=1 Tax=Brucella anthropi TaxID=529 RepID=UPI00366FA330